jgi:spore coat protein JB
MNKSKMSDINTNMNTMGAMYNMNTMGTANNMNPMCPADNINSINWVSNMNNPNWMGNISNSDIMSSNVGDIDRNELLKQIMGLDFYIIDMHLYLNTHPWDCKAIMLYNNMVNNARMRRSLYERMFGPLTAHMSFSKCPWQWTTYPFPWEKE